MAGTKLGRPRTASGPHAEYRRRHASAWYYANHEQSKARALRRSRANRAMIRAIKTKLGCHDCDYGPEHPRWHPDVIEFDHRTDFKKFRDISNMTGYSPKRILEEIAKCDAVCANCHRLRTAMRRDQEDEVAPQPDDQLTLWAFGE